MTRIALHLDEGETDTCEVDFRARTWLSSDTRWAAGVRERHRKPGRGREREPLLGLTRAAWAWACACVRMGVGGGASSGFAEGDAGGRTRQLEWIRNQITAVTRVPLRTRLLLRRGVQLVRNPEKRCLIITTHEFIVFVRRGHSVTTSAGPKYTRGDAATVAGKVWATTEGAPGCFMRDDL